MHVLVYHWSCYPKPDCCTWTVLMSPGRRSLCPIDKGLEITSLVLPSKRLKDTDICFAFIGWLMMCCTDGWVRMTGWIGMALGWWDACINTHSEGVHVKVFTGNNFRGSLSFLLHKLWDSPFLHFWWGLFHASAHHYCNNPYCTGPFLCTIDMYTHCMDMCLWKVCICLCFMAMVSDRVEPPVACRQRLQQVISSKLKQNADTASVD